MDIDRLNIYSIRLSFKVVLNVKVSVRGAETEQLPVPLIDPAKYD